MILTDKCESLFLHFEHNIIASAKYIRFFQLIIIYVLVYLQIIFICIYTLISTVIYCCSFLNKICSLYNNNIMCFFFVAPSPNIQRSKKARKELLIETNRHIDVLICILVATTFYYFVFQNIKTSDGDLFSRYKITFCLFVCFSTAAAFS